VHCSMSFEGCLEELKMEMWVAVPGAVFWAERKAYYRLSPQPEDNTW
jgi:hypothetical protein